MSDKPNDGGPAFPVPMTMDMQGNFCHSGEHPDRIGGMSLRAYGTFQILAGMAASDYWAENINGDQGGQMLNAAADVAIAAADATIAKLKAGEK